MIKQRRVWIAGPMHSGTSLAVNILREIMCPEENEKGSGEDWALVAANKAILKGTPSWNRTPVDWELLAKNTTKEETVEKMRKVGDRPCVLKDPKLVMTWSYWLSLSKWDPEIPAPHLMVVTFRSPEALAHAWSNMPGWELLAQRRRAVVQQLQSAFDLMMEPTIPTIAISIPDDIMRPENYIKKVMAITGAKEADAKRAVNKFMRPERYTCRG